MLKWVGRILYLVFIFFLFMIVADGYPFVELAYGLDYIEPAEDYQEAIARQVGLWGIYYSDEKIGNQSYSNVDEAIDDAYKITFSLYPLIVPHSTFPESNIYNDGFIISFEHFSEDVNGYTLELVVHRPDTNVEKVVRIVLGENITKYVVFASTALLANYRDNPDDSGETTLGVGTFDVLAIYVYAHIPNVEGKVPLYMTEQNGANRTMPSGLISPKDTNLILNHSDYSFSSILMADGEITADEIESYSIVDTYLNPDLSEYNHIYWIVSGVYLLLIIVIPYFWFFHKKVMAKFRSKNPQKPMTPSLVNPADVAGNLAKEQQIFSDVEPKSDKE